MWSKMDKYREHIGKWNIWTKYMAALSLQDKTKTAIIISKYLVWLP